MDLNNNDINISGIDRAIVCTRKGQHESFMLCPVCEYYPCSQLTKDEVMELNTSPLMDRSVVKLKPRRSQLFIIKYLDGTLKEAPDLDPSNPDRELMQNVETVYQVGKELVPVIVLKPKPKEERDKVLAKENPSKTSKKVKNEPPKK